MSPTPTRKKRNVLLAILLGCVVGISLALANADDADAHTVTSQQCYAYGTIHRFVTGASSSAARTRCNVAAQTHRCVHQYGSMSKATCSGMVRAARASTSIPDSWAWNHSLHVLLGHESGWNKNAVNDSSNACGLFQRLVNTDTGCPWKFTVIGYSNGTRIEEVHSSAAVQAANGYIYIDGKYGTPEAALAYFNENGSY